MKWIILILLLLIAGLQYRLWFGEGSFEQIAELEREIDQQTLENVTLQERNRLLILQIQELKTGTKGIEAKARQDMGMVKENETFYFIPDEPSSVQQKKQ